MSTGSQVSCGFLSSLLPLSARGRHNNRFPSFLVHKTAVLRDLFNCHGRVTLEARHTRVSLGLVMQFPFPYLIKSDDVRVEFSVSTGYFRFVCVFLRKKRSC